MIHFTLPFHPVSWMAAIKSGRRFFNPRDEDKRTVQAYLSAVYRGNQISVPIDLRFEFAFPYPKKLTKQQKSLKAEGKLFPAKMDTTNLIKFYEDCLKKIVITDDRNCIAVYGRKFYADEPFINIEVREI